MEERKGIHVVIGAKRGIGKATAKYLANKGEKVLALDYAFGEKEFTWTQGVVNMFVDVRDIESLKKLAAFLADDNFAVDSLVYCVGNNKLKWVGDGIAALAKDLYMSNVVGIFAALEAFLPMMDQDSRVVLFSSIAGEVAMRTTSVYCSTKAAVDHLTACLARELAPIAVFNVKPGPTDGDNSYADTEAQINETRGWPMEQIREMTLNDIPMKKLATEQECAEAVWWCVKEAPSHASGMTYRLTGGR